MKLKLSSLLLILLILNFPKPVMAASDNQGSLNINDQAIYDDGKNNQGNIKDYDVKTIFGPEMERKNHQLKQKADQPLHQGKKIVFTKQVRSQKVIDRHNRHVIKKYLFKNNYRPVKAVGNSVQETSWLEQHSYVIGILILVAGLIGLGTWLGIKFGKYQVRQKQEGKDERRFN
ncbi:hypothetical protein [Lactobacillus sp. PV034]|uniref:hypothetical protein n=1 Tax=Lactobacillus sp. PV034 TaxID=2594495 RepID=UPI00223FE451|nr:hypothetical protein [Lactobacillus sp. PV034]QNQ80160.1 hypothetical protein FP432_00625 [Lactobacillus sp. PV034]